MAMIVGKPLHGTKMPKTGYVKSHPIFGWMHYDKENTVEQTKRQFDYDVYLAGSLRNPAIPTIMDSLHVGANAKVFADWYAAGPEADDHWKTFYQGVGYTYREALKEPASVNTFLFDKRHMERSRVMVLALPAGKSGHLELGWFLGRGGTGYILLDSSEDRWDVMYQFATGVTSDIDELVDWISKDLA